MSVWAAQIRQFILCGQHLPRPSAKPCRDALHRWAASAWACSRWQQRDGYPCAMCSLSVKAAPTVQVLAGIVLRRARAGDSPAPRRTHAGSGTRSTPGSRRSQRHLSSSRRRRHRACATRCHLGHRHHLRQLCRSDQAPRHVRRVCVTQYLQGRHSRPGIVRRRRTTSWMSQHQHRLRHRHLRHSHSSSSRMSGRCLSLPLRFLAEQRQRRQLPRHDLTGQWSHAP